mmetsp:Transcript_45394/g.74251  ORF Transcript_45394/g.74251 Transcript_45394/m.74251 type:complete len:135 (-) Transcript_45394:38-442(-)
MSSGTKERQSKYTVHLAKSMPLRHHSDAIRLLDTDAGCWRHYVFFENLSSSSSRPGSNSKNQLEEEEEYNHTVGRCCGGGLSFSSCCGVVVELFYCRCRCRDSNFNEFIYFVIRDYICTQEKKYKPKTRFPQLT